MNTDLPLQSERQPKSADDSSEAIGWIDQREQRVLAPFAMHSRNSHGRIHPEQEHLYRGPFQRDRDRILHSWAYRRLSGKMQVFTGEMGDYHRTRLTHTQEVATIARTIGRALGLNEDLIEALALMHDIGHPPYGHAGEDALDECAKEVGGFSHNQFALTIVQELEIVYPQFPGLNLTMEVLAGQNFRADKANVELDRLLEVQLVDAADSTAYDAHDTDDALKLGLVSIDEMAELSLIKTCLQHVAKKFTALDDSLRRTALVHQLVELQVTQLISHCAGQLRQRGFTSALEAMSSNFLIEHADELSEQKRELERFLYENVYRHPHLVAIRKTAQDRLRRMFDAFCDNPELFPAKYQRRAESVGVPRMAVEYLAGMTDRFCEQTYEQIALD